MTKRDAELPPAQRQFLEVIDPARAHARWRAALELGPLEPEEVALEHLRGRVLAEAVASSVDVPGFDRSNVDGYAVVALDTYAASEEQPARLRLRPEQIVTGPPPPLELRRGEAVAIATGGVIPRGADAVVMVEDTDTEIGAGGPVLIVRRPAIPGRMVAFAGSDITRGEVVLRPGAVIGAREAGVLAAIGRASARVRRRPRVGILSTGDELVAPGDALRVGQIHDCNQTVLAEACAELGCEPVRLGIAPDDDARLAAAIERALADEACDALLLSGGTSKGAGDRSYQAVASLPPARGDDTSAIVVHGVALKPGKPLCLAATRRGDRTVPVAVLPGFPTSAIFTFREFVDPVLRAMAGLPPRAGDDDGPGIEATLPRALTSERGRRQYVLVQLVASSDDRDDTPVAMPISKSSGSISGFARADGFVAIARQQERVEAGERVLVQTLERDPSPAALTVIGSHCVGLERIADRMHAEGYVLRLIAQGSQGGLAAAAQDLCDIAPVHLYDAETGVYNAPFLPEGCTLAHGYGRMQGLVAREDDERFMGASADGSARFALPAVVHGPEVIMVNRNRGSGTRALVDELLRLDATGRDDRRPRGYHHEARSHQGVAACVATGRADWGVAIAPVARDAGLRFLPIRAERYDFIIPLARLHRPPVRRFLELLEDEGVRAELTALGFTLGAGPS